MPTPDLSPYVDLTFFDLDPQDIFTAAILDLQSKLPDWSPREGNIEVLLLEALALQVAEAVFAINRLPDAVVMAMLRMYGVEPRPGAQPTTTLTFTVGDTFGHSIPAGTAARLDLEGGLEPIVFFTDAELVIAVGDSVGTITATGDRFTSEGNGVPATTMLQLIDSIAFVDYVTLGSVVADGLDPETDDEWIERGVQRFSRLTETLVLPRHFITAALEDPNVARANAIDNWDGVDAATQGDDGGHITVVVYGEGEALTIPEMDVVDEMLQAQAVANLEVHVVAANIATVFITVTVVKDQGYLDADVQANVEAALQAYLSTDTWPWKDVIRRNEVIAVVGNAPGVAYVSTLTSPPTDVTSGGAPGINLARAGVLTVTVT